MVIDMILHCPRCGTQHIDAPAEHDELKAYTSPGTAWTNPPHRSHLCPSCGCIWRPAAGGRGDQRRGEDHHARHEGHVAMNWFIWRRLHCLFECNDWTTGREMWHIDVGYCLDRYYLGDAET